MQKISPSRARRLTLSLAAGSTLLLYALAAAAQAPPPPPPGPPPNRPNIQAPFIGKPQPNPQATPQPTALPATAPTTTPPAQINPTTLAPAPAQQPPHRARVDFSHGQLAIAADNSSLNQILREIEHLTGMKITGGVTDERVFGNYGPADTGTVLSTLLGGTGTNIMLLLNSQHAPAELVLTPRGGGPTPPSPNDVAHDPREDEDDLPPQREPHRPQPTPEATPVNPNPAVPNTTQPPTPPSTDTTTQQSPNGVKTPQQVYEQLMKLQQQKQQPGTPSTPPPPLQP